jgi:hypothetical protein
MNQPAELPELLSLPNGWHLITHGQAQISVDPAGLLLFPRHCTPDEAADWAAAIIRAAELGSKIRADNQAKAAANTTKGLPTRRVIVTEGPPPPGAIPLPQTQAAIGRPKRISNRRAP